MKIYLASSARNVIYDNVLAELRAAGHDVYDWKNPQPDNPAFGWHQLGLGDPKSWTPADFRKALLHDRACEHFGFDMSALAASDVCVLVLPCGRSAHLELGWAAGTGKRTVVLVPHVDEPELMYLMCDAIATSMDELLAVLKDPDALDAAAADALAELVATQPGGHGKASLATLTDQNGTVVSQGVAYEGLAALRTREVQETVLTESGVYEVKK